ncbi:MAG: hypothetical protein WCI74_10690, partial [Actinomycetes bacterium]
ILAKSNWFAAGGPWTGMSPERLGAKRPEPVTRPEKKTKATVSAMAATSKSSAGTDDVDDPADGSKGGAN